MKKLNKNQVAALVQGLDSFLAGQARPQIASVEFLRGYDSAKEIVEQLKAAQK